MRVAHCAVVSAALLTLLGCSNAQVPEAAPEPAASILVKGDAGKQEPELEPESGACDSGPCSIGSVGPGGGIVF